MEARSTTRAVPEPPTYDLAHLCGIHRWLFQDLYDWAGEIRTWDYSKQGSQFWPSDSIRPRAQRAFLSDVALVSGRSIAWDRVDRERNDEAERNLVPCR